ncbi:hypothetical protein GCK32_005837 [Trichostrongylus colubriformis]|uniref:RING-type E3 ubiquitin transferase BRCA1 n=1 Tax=Trichostrongylus colubriformis TaxID=6319 RepID=A0AAN8INQ8_TRICO
MSVQSLYEYALKINNVMAKIQSELKCGICRSTFSNPVSATCGHVFCKDCLDVVFQRRRVVECPLCRQSINKRSCTPSEQHQSMVQGYLQLGRNFLRDSQEQTLSIPKDVAFMDSQVPTDPKGSDTYFRERNPDHSTQCTSDLNALFMLMPELKDLLIENVPALCEILKIQPATSVPTFDVAKSAEDVGEGCSSPTISLDDFASDDDELNATQPPSLIKAEAVADAELVADPNENKGKSNEETGRPNSTCTRSSSDVVPQSSPSNDANDANDVDGEGMDITLQVPFDSVPCELDCYSSLEIDTDSADQKPMVISVSRMKCFEDEKIVSDFIKMFPQVRYEEEVTSLSTHLVMMNSHERLCRQRSLRYVFAVARKCELLDRSWLEESIKLQQLLPTTQYVLACETPDEESGWIRARQTTQPLFDQMSFFLPKTFSHSQMLSHEKLKELITLCGGTCCDKPWELSKCKNAYTIFMSHSTEWDVARRYEASMDGVPVVVADWVLDSIAEFRVKPIEPYKIRQKH